MTLLQPLRERCYPHHGVPLLQMGLQDTVDHLGHGLCGTTGAANNGVRILLRTSEKYFLNVFTKLQHDCFLPEFCVKHGIVFSFKLWCGQMWLFTFPLPVYTLTASY